MVSGPSAKRTAQLLPADLAVLEQRELRKDLPCTVTPVKPVLGFDLRFHAGYEVDLPLRDIAAREDLLTIVFRVAHTSTEDDPSYFTQRIKVPMIEAGARGDAYLTGGFDLGEGKYKVDWLMRDRRERVCSFHWDSEADLPDRDKDLGVTLLPGQIRSADEEVFKPEAPVNKATEGRPLNIKVLTNFAPQNANASALQSVDLDALVSMLRNIERDPRIGRISLVAFSLHERRVLYRQDDAADIDFPALGKALESLSLGTIDVERLSQKHGDTQFLADLVHRETEGTSQPDALVFVGPKALLQQNVAEVDLKETGPLAYPVFYMNYNLDPGAVPWRDAIGNVVKFFKGTEFTITRPRDLWYSVTEMVTRVATSRDQRQARLTVQ